MISRLNHMFKWVVEQELILTSVYLDVPSTAPYGRYEHPLPVRSGGRPDFMLGHARCEVAQIDAQVNHVKGLELAAKIG